MKMSRTTLKELAKRYRAVLLKCALINAGICIFAGMNANAEATTYVPTLYKIKTSETTYLNGTHSTYTLVPDASHDKETNSVIINGAKYWFNPNGDKDVVTLANTGGSVSNVDYSALITIADSNKAVFDISGTYYTYNAGKLPVSVYEVTVDETGSDYHFYTADTSGKKLITK